MDRCLMHGRVLEGSLLDGWVKNGRVLGEWKGVEWMGVEWLDGSVLVDRVLWLVVVCSTVAIGVGDEPIAMVLLLKFANAVRGGVLVDFFFLSTVAPEYAGTGAEFSLPYEMYTGVPGWEHEE